MCTYKPQVTMVGGCDCLKQKQQSKAAAKLNAFKPLQHPEKQDLVYI